MNRNGRPCKFLVFLSSIWKLMCLQEPNIPVRELIVTLHSKTNDPITREVAAAMKDEGIIMTKKDSGIIQLKIKVYFRNRIEPYNQMNGSGFFSGKVQTLQLKELFFLNLELGRPKIVVNFAL